MSTAPKRGIKRKRGPEELENSRTKSSKKVSIDKAAKFRTKLHHAIKEVKKAAKIAKTRETQRLVKKLKELRSKEGQNEAVLQLEKELEILKKLDHDDIACAMLLRRLSKDRHIQANEDAKAAVAAQMKQASSADSSDQLNATKSLVESRLCSSKSLAGQVAEQVAALRSLVLPTKETEEKPMEDNQAMVEDDEIGEEDGWESGSIGDDAELVDNLKARNDQDGEDSEKETSEGTSASDDDAFSDQSSAGKIPPPSKGHESATPMEEDESHSAFLPSLAVGYTRGDSDASDWSGDDGSVTGAKSAPRKNRRGQRARQAIWEKKYGKGAKHLVKAQESGKPAMNVLNRRGKANQSRPAKAGLPRRHDTSAHANSSRPTVSHWRENRPIPSGSNAVQPGQKDATLHPSWEAAKKRKAVSMVVPSTGKKIIF